MYLQMYTLSHIICANCSKAQAYRSSSACASRILLRVLVNLQDRAQGIQSVCCLSAGAGLWDSPAMVRWVDARLTLAYIAVAPAAYRPARNDTITDIAPSRARHVKPSMASQLACTDLSVN